MFFFFKQKPAYEMRISDWSSDVCSSDLWRRRRAPAGARLRRQPAGGRQRHRSRARAESSGGAGQALSAAGVVNRFPVGAASAASFSGIAGEDQELAAEAAPTRAFRFGTRDSG